MRALLEIAGKVAESGLSVTEQDIAAARALGADDDTIHDTVLIASAFCMYNRYVDGLAAITPDDPAVYRMIGAHLSDNGYLPGPGE
ncbi:carboxymuconolactone decarboxylase [Kitasatospora cheerisanensis KCTC 2395]|uniref:Carboxymuconolactone decarboxylase n=2 Tax=Kitasatospora cheerisanensis TaxID=81942 RepID=A0A066Z848_9ACTN|nr:carboxymuconolactone decarboxylase [Kitasatospora cheerisanensis KCTC 2395]